MNKIHQLLMSRLDVSPSDVKESRWQEELTAAVELGRPGDFSSTDICLKVYTVEKLHARCRQLHHLLFNDDEFACKVRSLLMPVPTSDTANNEVVDATHQRRELAWWNLVLQASKFNVLISCIII